MSQATAILGLLTETSLHAGIGQMVSVIDLPIQREAHTGWPCVYGSAVKGALRTLAEDKANGWVNEIFGPEMSNASEYAGALAVGDARLLLLPVRSLTSHFKWVTCPALLRRLQADCGRLRFTDTFPTIPVPPNKDTALVATEHNTDLGLFLEEFRFTPVPEQQLNELIKTIAPLMGMENEAEAALRNQLTVVTDDIFSHLARYATPVNAHIAIDNDTKIVKQGALWYEETLPPDSLLYVALVAYPVRKAGANKDAKQALGHIQELFNKNHPYLQLGGNETVGMGWCKVTFKEARLRQGAAQTPSLASQSNTSSVVASSTIKKKPKKLTGKVATNDAANDGTAKSPEFNRWGTPTDYYGQRWAKMG
jgi:CRISPR-associated protein Cmr4